MSPGSLAAIFGASFVVSLTGALAPGPMTTVGLRESVRHGFWAGPAIAIGHGVIELALVIALALGLNELLDNDTVTAVVALAGGGVLVAMGVSTVLRAPGYQLAVQSTDDTTPFTMPLSAAGPLALSGVVVSVSNPYWVAWWATIGTAYIVKALDEGALGVGAFYGAHILVDIGWLSLIAFAVVGGRRIMSERAYHGILIACGVFLVALGVWFLSSGIGAVV
jgi:threonine/homoserine/homoserine lactone efflux protein